MRVLVPRETAPGERRVALTPEAAQRLGAAGFEIMVERGAGLAASFQDDDYVQAGATLVEGTTDGMDGVVRVAPPSADETRSVPPVVSEVTSQPKSSVTRR